MFDKLQDLVNRYEDLMRELQSPDVANDSNRFRKLMKEQSDLAPIVEAYTAYKKANQDIEDSLSMLESESDEEMREMLKEELSESKKKVESLEQELKILLLPKDPNDEKNVIVESVPVQAGMRQRSLQRNYTVCMCILRKNIIGKSKPSMRKKPESAA